MIALLLIVATIITIVFIATFNYKKSRHKFPEHIYDNPDCISTPEKSSRKTGKTEKQLQMKENEAYGALPDPGVTTEETVIDILHSAQ